MGKYEETERMVAVDELKQLKEKLERERPVAWEELPDIALYMDQVISYMPRQLINFKEEEQLTSAMVNNYIKDGLVPRADGKRYSPTHLAYLTAVCALKKVLSVRDISNLIHSGEELGMDAEAMYGYFLRKLDKALSDTAETIDPDAPQKELAKLALNLALQSYAYQLACARILDNLQPDSGDADKKKSKK